MKTLNEAIQAYAGQAATALKKHLDAAGIHDWSDLTKSRLNDLKDHLSGSVCSNSARTYMAVLKGIMGRYSDEGVIPCRDYAGVLRAHLEKPMKTYLTRDEVARFEAVETKTPLEEFCKLCFVVGCRTGMRISDILNVNEANVSNGQVTYVSEKTSVTASIPVNERTAGYIRTIGAITERPTLAGYNKIVRRLAQRAGIDEPVKVFKAGKTIEAPKWECLSSHSARVSFASCLNDCRMSIKEISLMMGHTNTAQTERYIASRRVELNDSARSFLNV